jgi:orotidine-5'-phosphate decarboxylase
MSIDILQDKIRKMKNPSMLDLSMQLQDIPEAYRDCCEVEGYLRYSKDLMTALKDLVPALRLSFDRFALLGADGLKALEELLSFAGELGYYRLLDGPALLTPGDAQVTADKLFAGETYPCEALLVSPYIGTDGLKPFVPMCKEGGKTLFVTVRSPNKSAAEIQDLLSGSRLVHGAAAEIVSRIGEQFSGKYGYSRIAAAASAGSPESLRTLRTKHNRMFLLVDGLDYPSGNAKNCSYAFDRFGYGAVVCAGSSITAAWKEAEGEDCVSAAVQAAERMKKNLTRYTDIL